MGRPVVKGVAEGSRLRGNAPLRRFSLLLTGAGATQLVPILVAPLLTRLYAPDAYGVVALLSAITGLGAAVATGRYHQAILIPREGAEAYRIARLALFTSGGFCTLLTAVLAGGLLAGVEIAPFNALGWWILAAPLSAFLASAVEVATLLNLRAGQARAIAKSGVQRTLATAGWQVAISPLGGPGGLISGSVVGALFGNRALYRPLRSQWATGRITLADARRIAWRYSRFPLLDSWGALANVASYSLLSIMLASLYSAATVGQYALAYRTLTLPAAVVGLASAQFFLKEASDRLDSPGFLELYLRSVMTLGAMSAIVFGCLWFVARDLYRLLFGTEWSLAGEVAQAMLLAVAIRFAASPLSTVFSLAERQGSMLIIQTGLLGSTAIAVGAAATRNWSVVTLLQVYSALTATVYLMALLYGVVVAKGRTSAR